MPQEIAATLSRSTLAFNMFRLSSRPMRRRAQLQAPVIEAGAACSAIGLDDVAIHRDLDVSPSASRSIRRAERTADQRAGFPRCGRLFCRQPLAAVRSSVGPRQHAVFGGDQPRP